MKHLNYTKMWMQKYNEHDSLISWHKITLEGWHAIKIILLVFLLE